MSCCKKLKSSGHETVAFRCAAAVVVEAARKRMRTRPRKNDIGIDDLGDGERYRGVLVAVQRQQ